MQILELYLLNIKFDIFFLQEVGVKHLREHWNIQTIYREATGKKAPPSHCIVKFTRNDSDFVNWDLTFKNYLIPRFVQEHLFQIVESVADESERKYVLFCKERKEKVCEPTRNKILILFLRFEIFV